MPVLKLNLVSKKGLLVVAVLHAIMCHTGSANLQESITYGTNKIIFAHFSNPCVPMLRECIPRPSANLLAHAKIVIFSNPCIVLYLMIFLRSINHYCTVLSSLFYELASLCYFKMTWVLSMVIRFIQINTFLISITSTNASLFQYWCK